MTSGHDNTNIVQVNHFEWPWVEPDLQNDTVTYMADILFSSRSNDCWTVRQCMYTPETGLKTVRHDIWYTSRKKNGVVSHRSQGRVHIMPYASQRLNGSTKLIIRPFFLSLCRLPFIHWRLNSKCRLNYYIYELLIPKRSESRWI